LRQRPHLGWQRAIPPPEFGSSKTSTSPFLFTIDIEAREKISKLTLNDDDNQFFCPRILARPRDRGKQQATRRSHNLLQDAAAEIREYFNGSKSQVGESGYVPAPLRWRKYILESATVITMTPTTGAALARPAHCRV